MHHRAEVDGSLGSKQQRQRQQRRRRPQQRRRRQRLAPLPLPLLPLLALALLLLAPPAARAFRYRPDGWVTGDVWQYGDGSAFVFPELSDGPYGVPELQRRPDFAVALSGGGYRATTLALGWLRALHALGAMEKARYLSSNSGGSWINGAYSYSQVPPSQFFGRYLPPESLTLSAAKSANAPGSYGAAIASGTIVGQTVLGGIIDVVSRPNEAAVGAWSNAVGRAFLKPFGVSGHDAVPTMAGTRGGVGEAIAARYPEIPFVTACATKDK